MTRVVSTRTFDHEFNVRAFKATGDGSTDDTAAIQAAIDACEAAGGGRIRVPAGDYKLTTALKINASNIEFLSDPNVTFLRYANITMIQNGESGASAGVYTGNSNLVIDGGVWDMRGAVETGYNAAIAMGHGENITIRNLTIKDTPGYHAIEANAVKGLRVENCRFLGFFNWGNWHDDVRVATTANITLSGTQTIDEVSVVASDRVLVKNQTTGSENGIYVCAAGAWSRATDADGGTELDSAVVRVTAGTVNANLAFECSPDSITIGTTAQTWTSIGNVSTRDFSEAIQIDLMRDSGIFGAFGPYDDTPCLDVVIEGCYFGASGTTGTIAWPRGIGSHSAVLAKQHKRIRISNNTFDTLGGLAIGGYNWEEVVISDNTISGCGGGIRFLNVDTADTTNSVTAGAHTHDSSTTQHNKDITIAGNTIRNLTNALGNVGTTAAGRGIYFLGYGTARRFQGVHIRDNVIDTLTVNSSAHGVHVERADYASVTGNTIITAGDEGIRYRLCATGSVSDNTIMDAEDAGILLDTSDYIVCSGNLIQESDTHGIWCTGGTGYLITENFIRGAGRDTDDTHEGIRLTTNGTSGVSGATIMNNRIRKFGSGNEVQYSIEITSSCSGINCTNNDVDDSIIDAGTSPVGSAQFHPLAFHIPGNVTTGIKTPEFISPVAGIITTLQGRVSAGSGVTYRFVKNGSTSMTTSSSTSTTVVSTTNSSNNTVAVGDRIQIEVVNAGTSATDLSVNGTFLVTGT